MVLALYRELMEARPGDDKAMIDHLRVMVRAYQRGSWAMRAIVWVSPLIASVLLGFDKFVKWWVGNQ